MIDSELGLVANFVALPKEDFSEVVINANLKSLMTVLADENTEPNTSSSLFLNDAFGTQVDNGPSPTYIFSSANPRHPLMDISNVDGPTSKPQVRNQGKWSRIERKPTTNPSDDNMFVLNRERPALDEPELQVKKRRTLSTHGLSSLDSISAMAESQPCRSP